MYYCAKFGHSRSKIWAYLGIPKILRCSGPFLWGWGHGGCQKMFFPVWSSQLHLSDNINCISSYQSDYTEQSTTRHWCFHDKHRKAYFKLQINYNHSLTATRSHDYQQLEEGNIKVKSSRNNMHANTHWQILTSHCISDSNRNNNKAIKITACNSLHTFFDSCTCTSNANLYC